MSRSGDDPTVPSVQFIDAAGTFAPNEHAERYQPFLDRLTETDLQQFYRDMANVRAFDIEAAQVGSARAARAQDHIFPSYREHVVAMIRGVDPIDIVRLMRGNTHGGWDPADPSNGNMHLYTLVLAAQTLHATGYAMGLNFDKAVGTGDPDRDTAVLVYFGDGSSSEGDANEAYIYAASYQTPQVFFLQNNQWAISVPVSRQAREPLYQRAAGFGLDSVRIDGNDVLASYATAARW
jgi:2-oxoisovalerate dehydrogenase E1 component alpha subunit